MALTEKRVLASINLDFEAQTVAMQYVNYIYKDDVNVSAVPDRHVYGLADFRKLTEADSTAAAVARTAFGWTLSAADAAPVSNRPDAPPPTAAKASPVVRLSARKVATKKATAKKAKK